MGKAQAYKHITKHHGYVGCIKMEIDGREALFEGKVPIPSGTAIKACVARSGPDGMLIPGSRLSSDYGTFTEAFEALEHVRKRYQDAEVFGSYAVDTLKQ